MPPFFLFFSLFPLLSLWGFIPHTLGWTKGFFIVSCWNLTKYNHPWKLYHSYMKFHSQKFMNENSSNFPLKILEWYFVGWMNCHGVMISSILKWILIFQVTSFGSIYILFQFLQRALFHWGWLKQFNHISMLCAIVLMDSGLCHVQIQKNEKLITYEKIILQPYQIKNHDN